MARKLRPDKPLFIATLLLLGVSVVMVYSASAVLALDRFERPGFYLVRQGTWVIAGVCLLWAAMRIDYRWLRTPAVQWAAAAVTAAALIAVLFSAPINGTRRWFGIAGFGVQPSELAKITMILITAALLDRRMDRAGGVLAALIPIGALTAAAAGLILLQPDFGTAFALVVVVGAMVFTAGLPWRVLAAAGALLGPALYFLIMSAGYRRQRLLAFLDPWADPLGSGFQLIQSLIAVGTGGVFGLGLMNGVQKLHYLPEPHTDFIYAVIAEEAGLVGATVVLVCFAVIAWRGFRTAGRAPDRFGAFLAVGVTTMIASQALINMSVVLGVLPTTGIPLPFVSAGGSSLLISVVSMGVLLNVSQQASAAA